MKKRIGNDISEYEEDWMVVRTYNEFVAFLIEYGRPDIVSFDDLTHHTLTRSDSWEKIYDSTYDTEKTGADCAKYLVRYCKERDMELPICWVHSISPYAVDHILNALKEK